MEIKQFPTNQIKPDPNQPRKFFSDKRIREMAKSILTEGLINPIEIDKNGMIVTGEIRWRAAKEAGLKTVPTKLLEPVNGRFRRQVIENIHHNTMTAMETAEALAKLVAALPDISERYDAGIRRLSEEIGKSHVFILDHLNLLKESKEVKEYLSKPDSKYSLIRETNKYVPEEFRKEVKEKIIQGKIPSNRTVIELGKALIRQPEKNIELLEVDYSEFENDSQIISEIKGITPEEKTQEEVANRLIKSIEYIIENLRSGLLTEISPAQGVVLSGYIKQLEKHLKTWQSEDAVVSG